MSADLEIGMFLVGLAAVFRGNLWKALRRKLLRKREAGNGEIFRLCNYYSVFEEDLVKYAGIKQVFVSKPDINSLYALQLRR